MNLTAIIAEVRSEVRDESAEFITNTDITNWANHAQRDLANRLKLTGHTITGTTDGTKYLTFPDAQGDADPTLIEIENLRLGFDDDVEWVDSHKFDEWEQSGYDPGHTLGRVWAGRIEMYPIPANGTEYELRYYSQPDDLSGSDTSTVPEEMHVRIVLYCVFRAKLKAGELGEADRWQAMYEMGLPPHPLGKQRANPGPLDLTFKPNVFDIDPEAAHN